MKNKNEAILSELDRTSIKRGEFIASISKNKEQKIVKETNAQHKVIAEKIANIKEIVKT